MPQQQGQRTPIPPTEPLSGRVSLPGSKSLTNRALLLAALAEGTSHLAGALKSDDTEHMARALRSMGVAIEEPDATSFTVHGTGRLAAPAAPLFLGNAGTATRFLAAAAGIVDGPVVIDGDAHMRRRPIAPLAAALQALGIDVETTGGCPPVTVRGTGRPRGGVVEVDAALSSQYVSALLMLGPRTRAGIEIRLRQDGIGARGYVDLTTALMRRFGAAAQPDAAGSWHVAPTGYRACDLAIEPDASAATYLWAAGALTGGRIELGVAPDRFTQPDARAHPLIAAFPRMPAVIEGSQMQDAVPTLAVLAAFNAHPVRFTGIANLRVKECDRIAALADGLCRIAPGLGRIEGDDLVVEADPTLAGRTVRCRIDTVADHRIAMSFALAGLRVAGISILDPGCVAKTYPGYWDDLARLGLRYEDAGSDAT